MRCCRSFDGPSLRWACAGLISLLVAACAAPDAAEVPQDRLRRAERPAVPADAFAATVVRVVDGDTFLARRASQRVRVRLIGIDAPESVAPDRPAGCFGRQAAAHLRSVLRPGASIRATFQGTERLDDFGRELWDVWLSDATLLQEALVRRGFARARAYPPHERYAGLLRAAEQAARRDRAGLHGTCP